MPSSAALAEIKSFQGSIILQKGKVTVVKRSDKTLWKITDEPLSVDVERVSPRDVRKL